MEAPCVRHRRSMRRAVVRLAEHVRHRAGQETAGRDGRAAQPRYSATTQRSPHAARRWRTSVARFARRRRRTVALAVALVIASCAVLGCAGGSGHDTGRGSAPATGTLTMPAGTDTAARAQLLEGIRARLARIGSGSEASASGDVITIRPSPDRFVLEALARRTRTTVVAVDSATLGRCVGNDGVEAAVPVRRCYHLGAPVTDTTAVTGARVTTQAIDGWGVDVTIPSDRYPAFRAAVLPHQGSGVAIVADGAVLADASLSTIGLMSRIGGQLRRFDARRIAAALPVDTDLPVALSTDPPRASDAAGPGDVWMSQLEVDVCGRRLPPAPSFVSETGVHSHADGLVYVHSLPRGDAGHTLTLGDFAEKGGWTIAADQLDVWGGVDVHDGDACDGRRDTTVRWSVDGVPGTGSPADIVLGPGHVIVIAFGPRGAPLPEPPAANAVLVTTWGPRLP